MKPIPIEPVSFNLMQEAGRALDLEGEQVPEPTCIVNSTCELGLYIGLVLFYHMETT